MSDVDAVIGLLERWRDASGMQRVRIGIDATRTVGALPAERKRALATEVARRVAPQLVPAIESESGDLSSEQVAAVIDLLRRADREQLDDLIGALRTGDVMGALDLVDDAVDIVAPQDPDTAELLEDVAEPDDSEVELGDEELPDEGVPSRLLPDEVEVADDGTVEVDEEAIREQLRVEAAAKADRWRDTSEATSHQPAYRAPLMDFGLEFELDDADLPDPHVQSVAPLSERRGQLPGATEAPRAPAAVLRAGPVTAVLAAITAIPDGYRRRRAAMAAIRDERLETDDVHAVVRSLASPTDRAWVAGAALDADLIAAGDLAALDLSPAARARLARRAS